MSHPAIPFPLCRCSAQMANFSDRYDVFSGKGGASNGASRDSHTISHTTPIPNPQAPPKKAAKKPAKKQPAKRTGKNAGLPPSQEWIGEAPDVTGITEVISPDLLPDRLKPKATGLAAWFG